MRIADRYDLGELLGEGGMGSVVRAVDMKTGRAVAVKLMRRHLMTDISAVRRFEREMHAMMLIEHPNTVRLYDFGRTEADELYLVMELVEGRSLDEELQAEGVLAIERIVRIGQHVARALAAVHAKDVVHRDLKPQNIMLRDLHGERDWALVLDFGIATLRDAARVTETGMIAGSPAYCCPEQALGALPGPAGDLYMLGVVLYEMTTGRLPFVASSQHGFLYAHVHSKPDPIEDARSDVPRWLTRLILDLLEKDPKKRPADAATVLFRLAHAGALPGPSQTSERRAAPGAAETDVIRSDSRLRTRDVSSASRRRHSLAWGAMLVAVALVALVIALVAERSPQGEAQHVRQPELVSAPVPSNEPARAADRSTAHLALEPPARTLDSATPDVGQASAVQGQDAAAEVSMPDANMPEQGPDTRGAIRGAREPTSPPKQPPPALPSGQRASTVQITSLPSNANASSGGRSGVTPWRLSCEAGTKLTVRVSKPNYLPTQRTVTCGRDHTVHVLLVEP